MSPAFDLYFPVEEGTRPRHREVPRLVGHRLAALADLGRSVSAIPIDGVGDHGSSSRCRRARGYRRPRDLPDGGDLPSSRACRPCLSLLSSPRQDRHTFPLLRRYDRHRYRSVRSSPPATSRPSGRVPVWCPKPFWTLNTGLPEVSGAPGAIGSRCTSSHTGFALTMPAFSASASATKSMS